MPTLTTPTIAANGQTFCTRLAGSPNAPLVLFLHGFPEYGGAFDDLLPRFADRWLAVAPDQRGYGQSSKPVGGEHYRVQLLAADMLALAETIAPGRPIHVVAHDWGASVGYMMAFLAPQRIAKLVVLNGVHPKPFQRALIEDPEQRVASQYIGFLRRPDAAQLLLADGCRRTLDFLTSGFGAGRWMTDAKRQGYLTAWQQPGAMEGMVSWYKATPLVVPKPGEAVAVDPMARITPEMVRVRMPHLVIWGLEDKALRPSTRVGLDAYCDDLRMVDVADADHWIVHQQPDRVTALIRDFLG